MPLLKKVYLAIGIIAVMFIAGIAIIQLSGKNSSNVLNFTKNKISLKAAFASVGRNAFDLKSVQANNLALSTGGAAGITSSNSAETQTKALSSITPTPLISQSGSGAVSSAPAADKSMVCMPDEKGGCVLPPQLNYEYVYKGEDIKITAAEMPVYKRVKGFGQSISAGDIFSNFNFDGVNLQKFQSASVDNVNLIENRDYGFSVYINFTEGNFSFNQNWLKWPQPGDKCRDKACWNSIRVKESDLPSNDEAIKIADNFLKEYEIKLDGFGPGEVQDDWKIYYANTANKADYYFPETISVIYPQMVNSQPVFDEWGNKQGVNISISVRDKRVSGVWNLASQNYQTSLYAVETDQAKILELMKNSNSSGGIIPMLYGGREDDSRPVSKTRQIEVGTPALGLARMWIYKNNISDELLVPALIFPITKNEIQYFNQKYIVVPLVKEIIDQRKEQDGGGPVRIMEGTSSSGPTGSPDVQVQSSPSAATAPVESE
ncbi:MAG: hypothetical protein WCW77_02510 [Patescibacteria group bacterium]|jgi:hypothetical protein